MNQEPVSAEDDVPVLIFEGDLSAVTFLASFLRSGGIDANVADPSRPRHQYKVFVPRRDASDALAVVAEFQKRSLANDRPNGWVSE